MIPGRIESGQGSKKYRFLIKILKVGNGFEARGGSGAAEDRKSIDFLLKIIKNSNGFEARGGSGAAGDRKSIDS